MWRIVLIHMLVTLLYGGCCHTHTMVATDVADIGESICTKYRYYISDCSGTVKSGGLEFPIARYALVAHQPLVFTDNSMDGIPLSLDITSIAKDFSGGGWTMIFTAMSCGILPCFATEHRHLRWEVAKPGNGEILASGEVCARGGDLFCMWLPVPMLLFNLDWNLCLGGRKFDRHSHEIQGNMRPVQSSVVDEALAYAIAARLKYLEDEGKLIAADDGVARMLVRNGMAAGRYAQALAKSEALRRGGVQVGVDDVIKDIQTFDVIRCEKEKEKNFIYRFELKGRAEGGITLFDYNVIRRSFRAMIRAQYAREHPEANHRSVVVDFIEYTMRDGWVRGRAAVFAIEVRSLIYDAATRKGVITAETDANQFDDVRRYLRQHIGEIASRSNVVSSGDAIPQDGRFYIGRETMLENGVLEIEFKTE